MANSLTPDEKKELAALEAELAPKGPKLSESEQAELTRLEAEFGQEKPPSEAKRPDMTRLEPDDRRGEAQSGRGAGHPDA